MANRMLAFVTFVAIMGRTKEKILERIMVLDVAAEGKAIARHEGKVIFIRNAVPGDVVDLRVYRSKSSFAEAEAIAFHTLSAQRDTPFCNHFGICGGCKWQDLQYAWQLQYKQKQVLDQFARIGKVTPSEVLPIVGVEHTRHYRNKMEYTFSAQRWMTPEEIASGAEIADRNGLGFHIPGRFDKILDIASCGLQDDMGNQIRNQIRSYAVKNNLSFFDLRRQEGALRTMILRNTTVGEWMLVLAFGCPADDALQGLMQHIVTTFPVITTLVYVVNQKKNDTIHDLPVHIYHGPGYIHEQLGSVRYRIGPKSFFQTNTLQAQRLYDITLEFAGLTGHEHVYDLYTGTGSIACYIASRAKKVTGVEYVEDAVADARVNAGLNGISNMEFFAGDMKDVLTPDFIRTQGIPDVVITDPPRAGMHEDVVKRILEMQPQKVVYVSCNPATQARDIALMSELYSVEKLQPVDMFPHTYHVENVALLKRNT